MKNMYVSKRMGIDPEYIAEFGSLDPMTGCEEIKKTIKNLLDYDEGFKDLVVESILHAKDDSENELMDDILKIVKNVPFKEE